MKISVLCSGSTGNSCVVEDRNTKLMIDCGGTKGYLLNSLKTLQLEINDLDALLLTHGHTDHISQIKHFKGINTFGTFTCDKVEMNLIGTHESFEVKDLKICSLPLSHDFPKTVGFKIVGESTLVYITDTGYVNERLFEEIKNADFIVLECNHDPGMLMKTNRPFPTKQRIMSSSGHLSNSECARVLSKIIGPKTKEVILAHISAEGNTYKLAEEIVKSELDKYKVDYSNIRIRAAEAFTMIQMGDVVYD